MYLERNKEICKTRENINLRNTKQHVVTNSVCNRIFIAFDELGFVEAWIIGFTAHARANKLKGYKECGGENEIADLFLAATACETIMKIFLMTYPKELEKLTFNQTKEIILKKITPQTN